MKKVLAMALIGCMTFGMAACGSGSGEAPAPAKEEAPAADDAAAEEASADDAADEEAPADSAAGGDKVWIVATDTVFKSEAKRS